MTRERREPRPWRVVLLLTVLVVVVGGGVVAAARAVSAPAGQRTALMMADAPAADAGAAARQAPAPRAATSQAPSRRAGAQALGCEGCHGELELLRQQSGSLTRAEQLLVPGHVVAMSAHGDMTCAGCHAGYTRYPHDERATSTQTCQSCHAEADSHWRAGAHFTADEQVTCVQCHTTHDIRTVEQLRTPEGAATANAPCLGCHESARLERHAPHADGVQCAACHAPHEVRPVHDPASWMAPARQLQTCGTCHDSIAAVWSSRDIHGHDALRGAHLDGREPAAETVVCTSCHIGHRMVAIADERFAALSVERCAECHEHGARTFFASYHGKATALGSRVAASCSDCHGAHDILPDSMPASRVAQANLVETCRACHEYARPAFVQYDAHPDPFNRQRNPWIFYSFWMMNGLLIFVLLVFGTHTILWWVRLWLDKRRGIIHGPGQSHGQQHGHGGH
jgi:hypothetical protein